MPHLRTLLAGFWTICLPVTVLAAGPIDYLRDIKPVLKERCFACHGALKQQSGLRLDTGKLIRHGGDSGPAVVAGNVSTSRLLERIQSEDPSLRMPPEGKPLSAEQIQSIRAWIEHGATSPEGEQPEQDPREHWAFKRPVKAPLPMGGPAASAANPVDAFISAKHQQLGFKARPVADKSILLRRVYLDLIGLPPTRDELQAFLADDSPQAFETVVDRLLNDVRYGERWGRHWMDIWRYSDWYGRRHVPDVWNSAPQIWRWRDWIVRSLNADKGYDRMLQEMLAADEICPDDDEATVATGYLIRNWYALNPNDWMRSTVEHTGKAFLGLTFNCAHCHDHKYDPISQDNYFQLRAFFEPIGIRQDRVPGEADPGPYQEYNYSSLRKIQRLGAVRIFDKNPAAPTWFYTGGDERNRVASRGSMTPGLPVFLSEVPARVESVSLPVAAWYPGLRPALQGTLLADRQAAIKKAETELAAVRSESTEVPAALKEQMAQAEAAYEAARQTALQSGQPGALAGQQSLKLDASAGRRILFNSVPRLKALAEGTTLTFQVLLLTDTHFNFQFAKDAAKGLTAGYVGFENGHVMSYRPGSFAEFAAGNYDFAGGQKWLQISLKIEPKADRCLLSVRSLSDDKLLVDNLPVALNGWSPIGDANKPLTFDARTGSVVVLDEIRFQNAAGEPLLQVDFEAPAYPDGHDVVGSDGWTACFLSVAPATSIVSSIAANASLREVAEKLQVARHNIERPMLRLKAAEATLVATRAELASLEARVAADRAKFEVTHADARTNLARRASELERGAAVSRATADVLSSEYGQASAEQKPATDANRAKELEAAGKQLAAAKEALGKATVAIADASKTETYSPLGPTYPQTSTGRRRALAEWMTSRQNPLTARVAVNHIWARHLHTPLVNTVSDFGRNGAAPTHPELLDWLAVDLMESGWSMKQLHRLLVTSETYRRISSIGSAAHEANADPENKFLWRMNAGRMEAEVVRDSLLYVAAKLDRTMGGQELENGESLTSHRRSLYYAVFPELGGKSSMGELFDAPDALECYRRTRSVIPQQALALTNSEFVHQMAAAVLAEEEHAQSSNEPSSFVISVFERVLSRRPTEQELALCVRAIEQPTENVSPSANGTRGRASLVRVLLNHNDFITIR